MSLESFHAFLEARVADFKESVESRRRRYLCEFWESSFSMTRGQVCGARRKRSLGWCQRPAGWGTCHVGWGTCKLHCGSTKSGIHAAVVAMTAGFNEYARQRSHEEWDDLFQNAEADFAEAKARHRRRLRNSERSSRMHAELRREGKPRAGPTVSPELADELIRRRARGESSRALARDLNEREVPTARGGASWYSSTVLSATRTRERELAAQRPDH